ncbi:hypothetical protein ANO14919_000930 [Xylariales sp. No.14919]|nr:hypothetical protein ANO14919_000930 [Xylariales sp. No.14919]
MNCPFASLSRGINSASLPDTIMRLVERFFKLTPLLTKQLVRAPLRPSQTLPQSNGRTTEPYRISFVNGVAHARFKGEDPPSASLYGEEVEFAF